jgi:hypothetical protein
MAAPAWPPAQNVGIRGMYLYFPTYMVRLIFVLVYCMSALPQPRFCCRAVSLWQFLPPHLQHLRTSTGAAVRPRGS